MSTRMGSKKKKLLKVIQFTFLFCIGYLAFFLFGYFTCNSEIENCIYQSDLNTVFAITAGLCYVINIAAQIQAFFTDEKKHKIFFYYRILAGVMTIIAIMVMIISSSSSPSQPNEFMTPTTTELE